MELKEVYIGAAIVLIGVLAFFGLADSWNIAYGEDAGETLTGLRTSIEGELSQNLSLIGEEVSDNTALPEGEGVSDQSDALITQSRGTLGTLRLLLGIIPNLITNTVIALGIPGVYAGIAKTVFYTIFGITIMYLLLLGVRRVL